MLRKQYNFCISKKELYHRYSDLQQSAPDIARQIGCSKRTVLLRLKDYQIPVRSGRDAHNIQSYLSKFKKEIPEPELRAKYIDEKLGAPEIAILYNCSANCVRSNLRRYGIHVRTRKEAQDTPACITGKMKTAISQRTVRYREYRRGLNSERYKDVAERARTKETTRQAYINDPTIRIRQAEATKRRMADPLVYDACVRPLVEYAKSDTHRIAQSRRATILWQDSEYRTNQVAKRKMKWRENNFEMMRRMMLANCVSPNRPETSVLKVLEELYPNEWKFTGDGQVIIDGLNPDFVNTNGKKLIIEVFGDYWHRQGIKPYRINEGRVDVYARYGYRTLIIWERETKNVETLRRRIQEFVGYQKAART